MLELTYRCNHGCLFCSCPWFADDLKPQPELGLRDWKGVLSELCEAGVSSLAFTGGEPLLKEGALDLLRYAGGLRVEHVRTEAGALVSHPGPPRLFLLSNGLAMSDEVLDLCAELGVRLSMSLPGLRAFCELTGGARPERVLGWFHAARARGVTTTVGITVTRKNLGELYETISEAFLAGADLLLLNRFLPGGRGLSHADELVLDAEQVVQMCDIAEEVLHKADRYGSVGTELPKCVVDPSRYTRLTVGTRCSAALDFFVIGPSGWVRVCNHSPERLVPFARWRELKAHPYWQRFRKKAYLPPSCLSCASMGSCDAGCREAAHILTGDVAGLDGLLSCGGPGTA